MDSRESITKIIQNTGNIVVLTGAGISTESGIRDFRSRRGLYTIAPEEMLSLDFFYEYPKEFYDFAIQNLYHPAAKPNRGHEILAEWEKDGRIAHLITQNIDGLHQKAGSRNLIEFHGTMKTVACQNCGEKYSIEELIERMKERDDFYICSQCSTVVQEDRYIKPDVVLFGDKGEWFTADGVEHIINVIKSADCLLILGTSLTVTPFSLLPQYKESGVPMIIINKGSTPYDYAENTFVIDDSIGLTLERVNSGL